jgi:hypothetical protein
VKGYAFLEPARDELAEAVEFYNDRRSGLGDDLAAEVERAIAIGSCTARALAPKSPPMSGAATFRVFPTVFFTKSEDRRS